MLEGIHAIIFDLDGTLVDSMWIWEEIDIEYLNRFHLTFPENFQLEIAGMSFSETAAYFKNKFNLPDPIEKIKMDWNAMAKEKYKREVPLKQGVKKLLDYCWENEIKLGIATSNSRELVEEVVNALEVACYFNEIHTACEVEKGKPEPDIYLLVAECLGVMPENCLVFEDIPQGLLAGKRAGMKVCAVDDRFSAAQEQEKRKIADYFLECYEDIF